MQVNQRTIFFSPSTAKILLQQGPRAARDSHSVLGTPAKLWTPSLHMGKLIDRLTFGVGPEIVEINADRWSPKVKAQREDIEKRYAIGALPREIEQAGYVASKVLDYLRGNCLEIVTAHAQRKITFKADGVDCKCILDYATPGSGLVIDLKSCSRLSRERALESAWNYRYDIQAAAYREAADNTPELYIGEPSEVVLLFVDSKTGECLELYCNENAMAVGNHEWKRARKIWRECLETGNWPETIEGANLDYVN